MNEEQLSAGYTVILQGVICSFLAIFLGLIIFIFKDVKLDETPWLLLMFIIIFILVAIIRLLSFADVYISNGHIMYKKITGIKSRPLSEIKGVYEGILPHNYYVEFIEGKRVYFQLKPGDLL